MKEQWFVDIICSDTDEVFESIPTDSLRKAERVEDGIMINLNHEEYYTKIRGYENEFNLHAK